STKLITKQEALPANSVTRRPLSDRHRVKTSTRMCSFVYTSHGAARKADVMSIYSVTSVAQGRDAILRFRSPTSAHTNTIIAAKRTAAITPVVVMILPYTLQMLAKGCSDVDRFST